MAIIGNIPYFQTNPNLRFPCRSNIGWEFFYGFLPAESIRCHTVASPLKILGKSTDKMPWGKANWFLVVTKKNIKFGIGTIETGWWFQPTPLKNHGVKVSWDDEIPKMMGKLNFMFQITNQEPIGR